VSQPIRRATVVVATYNRAQLLRGCLRALERQVGVDPFEVVVVDDASSDETQDVLHAWTARDGLRGIVLQQVGNRGPAAARNRGVAVANAPVVAFTNDDCEPDPMWLSELVSKLEDSPPVVVGVGGRVLSAGEGLIGSYMTHHRILEPPASLSYLVTANCAYRRAAILDVDGFDEAIRQPGGEDPGLSLELGRRGYRFAFCEKAVVRHHYRESLIDFAKTFFRYGKGCSHVLAG
jgi:GT2 family glycosyltransferase